MWCGEWENSGASLKLRRLIESERERGTLQGEATVKPGVAGKCLNQRGEALKQWNVPCREVTPHVCFPRNGVASSRNSTGCQQALAGPKTCILALPALQGEGGYINCSFIRISENGCVLSGLIEESDHGIYAKT